MGRRASPIHDAGPLRRVLVATDLSAHGRRAVMRAAQLPLAAAADVEILHVIEDPRLAAGAQRELAEEAAKATATIAGRRAGVRVAARTVPGSPPEAIVERANARAAELVVLGRHGHRFFRDLIFGSTVERVVRASVAPVLVVSGQVTGAYRRPLMGVDLSPTSCRRALDVALRILGPTVDRIDVVHALDDAADRLLLRAGYPTDEILRERDARRRRIRASVRALLADLHGDDLRWRASVVAGDPRRAILGAAARRRSDLVILGTHSRVGLERVLLGSTAEGVLRSVACDALVARSAEPDTLREAA